MRAAGDESRRAPPFAEAATARVVLTFASCCRPLDAFVILIYGGSALVRRRIQTPSDATVLSVVQPEGEVVLGASPLARHLGDGPEGGSRRPGEARPPLMSAAQALPTSPTIWVTGLTKEMAGRWLGRTAPAGGTPVESRPRSLL